MAGSEQFVEVLVNTPLEVWEARDTKGMYAKARRGEPKGFAGIDDPHEPPEQPEITLDTVTHTRRKRPADSALLAPVWLRPPSDRTDQ